MTRILHTADIHLREYGDERWNALEKVVETGREEGVDVLIISGDLFNEDTDAHQLRDRIREVFTGNGFPVVLLPGNHDRDSYAAGLYFGEDVILLADPFSSTTLGEVNLWGLPFAPLEEGEVVKQLHALSPRLDPHRTNVLLFHGELLDAFFSHSDLGAEGEHRYMPAHLSSFAHAGLDFVLAGHFHTSFRVWPLPDRKGSFIYPGSPVSITSREKGPRKVNLLDLASEKPPREITLDTFHYEEILVQLDPFQEKDPLRIIKERLTGVPPSCQATLKVTGYFNGAALGYSETQLAESIREILSRSQTQLQAEFKDLHTVLEDPLARRFLEKLEASREPEETKERMRQLGLQAMMEVKG